MLLQIFLVLIVLLVERSDGFSTSLPLRQAVRAESYTMIPQRQRSCSSNFDHDLRRLAPLHASVVPAKTAALVLGHVIGGALAAPLTARAIKTWYAKIDLPSWTPPNKIFGPVWTLLYASMGYAASRILHRTAGSVWYKTLPMQWWIVHCTLNVLWAPLFFGLRQLRASAVLNLALLATLVAGVGPVFYSVDATAALVLIPYALWLVFANALNLAICRLNPGPYNAARFHAELQQLQRKAATYAGL